jgi:preprotein translocase subunit SecG
VFLYVLVLAVHVLVSVFLILVVLLQSGKGGDIASAFGGAGSQTVFGPRGTTNVLSKATTWSAGIFMATSLALVLLSQGDTGSSVISGEAPTPAAPAAPAPQPPAPDTAPTQPAPPQPAN